MKASKKSSSWLPQVRRSNNHCEKICRQLREFERLMHANGTPVRSVTMTVGSRPGWDSIKFRYQSTKKK